MWSPRNSTLFFSSVLNYAGFFWHCENEKTFCVLFLSCAGFRNKPLRIAWVPLWSSGNRQVDLYTVHSLVVVSQVPLVMVIVPKLIEQSPPPGHSCKKKPSHQKDKRRWMHGKCLWTSQSYLKKKEKYWRNSEMNFLISSWGIKSGEACSVTIFNLWTELCAKEDTRTPDFYKFCTSRWWNQTFRTVGMYFPLVATSFLSVRELCIGNAVAKSTFANLTPRFSDGFWVYMWLVLEGFGVRASVCVRFDLSLRRCWCWCQKIGQIQVFHVLCLDPFVQIPRLPAERRRPSAAEPESASSSCI